jgi:Flp pilus assembly protein TadG
MKAIRNEPSKPERGQVLVLFALGLTAFVFVLALILDGGRVYAERRRTQNAADAAATAGASALTTSNPALSLVAVQTAACKAAKANGFGSGSVDSTCGPTGSDVVIHVPNSGDGVGNLPNVAASFTTSGYVQVAVRSNFVSIVQSWLGGGQIGASALAVAVNIHGSGIGYSVLVLNPADCGSFNINGTTTNLTVHNGGVMVDSAAAKSASPTCIIKNAATVSGGASLTTDLLYKNNVHGTGDPPPALVTPPFTNDADFVVDPLAFIDVPDFGQTGWRTGPYVPNATHPTILGQPALNNSPGNPSLGPQPWKNTASNPYPDPLVGMPPGVIWGGIEVHNGDILVLKGGTYIMAGGGFNIQGGSVFALNPITIIMTDDKFCSTSNSANCSSPGLKGNGDLSTTVGQSTGAGTDSWGSPVGFACAAVTNPLACQPIDAPAVNPDGEDYLNHILIYIDRYVGSCSSGTGNPSVGNTTFIAGGGGSYYFADGTIIYAPCSTVDLHGTESPFPSHAGSVEAFNVSVSGNKTLELGGPGAIAPAPAKTNLVQ